MATILPITLIGDNLGKRHKYLNSLVNETYKKTEEFSDIQDLPEKSPIDRLFKIDLALKIKNVDYIIHNLKNDDMLYVSRSLKAIWLMETKYEEIINPKYLEERLYPEMIVTAVNKMQHWIHLNLTDELRCNQFFQYYREKNFKLAIKFLLKCSKDVIQNEFTTIMYKITPHYLKVMSEKCPQVAKIFFDSISKNDDVKRLYLTEESAYFDTLRHLLKSDPDVVFDISEKYFNEDVFKRFSVNQTKYIMKHHKNRFWKKPELYTAWLLNMQALADSLTSEEAKDLVLKLARAVYLDNRNWFYYDKIEPFIKRLKPDEQNAFKHQIFVEKNIGQKVKEWPYKLPKPANEIEYVTILDDRQSEPSEYGCWKTEPRSKRRCLPGEFKKKKKKPVYYCETEETEKKDEDNITGKTLLEKLSDEFRFASFGQTLFELRKRIAAESAPNNREFMMLYLISKTRGRPDAVALLLELLERHDNEPVNVRAAIIRSLIKRAKVWRLPKTSWDQLMKFGQGLGLDGKTLEADCLEGLHAVIIRSLLQNGDCEPDIKNTFLEHFSVLTDYCLNSAEKKVIATSLPKMLLQLAKEKETNENVTVAVHCIEKLIETLDTFTIELETYPGLIDTIVALAEKNDIYLESIIRRLYYAKIARKQLFRFTFGINTTDESYLNALRHDVSVLDPVKFVKHYSPYTVCADNFFKKLSLYFSEDNGIASKYLHVLISEKPSKIHGRILAILLNNDFESYLNKVDALTDKDSKSLGAALRANSSLSRPSLDINVLGWKKVGAKYVGNKLIKCRNIDIDSNIKELLKWKRTAKTALALSKRSNYQNKVFLKLASLRPLSAIKAGLKLMHLHGDKVDSVIWKTIKPIIQELDLSNPSFTHIVQSLVNIDKVPMKIRPEYSTLVYTLLLNIDMYNAMPSLCHVEILLTEVDKQFLESFVHQFLQDDFKIEKLSDDEYSMRYKQTCLCLRIFIKYLLLSENEEDQTRKVKQYLEPFLTVVENFKTCKGKRDLFKNYFPQIILTLKYSKVFLHTKYVSPLPLIEKIIAWMRKYYTIAEYFKTYAQLHLLMLFYKATQEAVKMFPGVFSDNRRKRTEGVEIFCKIFSKFISSEVNCLQDQYFESMPEMYIDCLVAFLDKFNDGYIVSDLLSFIIKGFFEQNVDSAYRLGIYLMKEKRSDIDDDQIIKLVTYVNQLENTQAQWFVSTLD